MYGVTTGFGGLANTIISPQDAAELQENLIWFMKTESGKQLPKGDVRAAMVIRANSHLIGFPWRKFPRAVYRGGHGSSALLFGLAEQAS